jgi:membrane protein implicated in regulation of membrane protease activity
MFVVPLLFTLTGLSLVLLAVFLIRLDRAFLRESKSVTGNIVAVNRREFRSRQGTSILWSPTIEYTADNQKWQFEADGNPIESAFKIGQSTSVLVSNNNPRVARIGNNISSSNRILYLLGGVGLVFTVLGMAIIDVSALTLEEPIPLVMGAVVLVMLVIRGIPIVKRIKTTPRFKESEAVEG